MAAPTIESTPIPGMVVVRLDVHEDARGWFKENWQREKMVGLGLPDFGPVQNNISFNATAGATRGIHAEPWDKFVSVGTGRVFGAWVDLREGDSFGTVFTIEITPWVAVFVPRGVGNAFQTLEDATSYTYLVNGHWRPGTTYPALALDDPTAAISWPIPLADAELSAKDRQQNPQLAEVTPMAPRRTIVLGGNGQLGRALAAALPAAEVVDRDRLDLTDTAALRAWPWADYATIINAAAWTAVDAAEDERQAAWAANATGPGVLARIARDHGITLVHYSTDYVFDGTRERHREDEPVAPLGVYGQSKAAGEVAVAGAPRHYVLRASWVVGDGSNFVRTMASLADRGISPRVVDDQHGRLTFASELARATVHLLANDAPFGTYHVSNGGPISTWAGIAREVFRLRGRDPEDVTGVSTEDYFAGTRAAPRPRHSVLDLAKLEATGFTPTEAWGMLSSYVAKLPI
jgi:dTDP-4-dehydrorhamnose 3,5-epimerase